MTETYGALIGVATNGTCIVDVLRIKPPVRRLSLDLTGGLMHLRAAIGRGNSLGIL
jgi:hypothetical protein